MSRMSLPKLDAVPMTLEELNCQQLIHTCVIHSVCIFVNTYIYIYMYVCVYSQHQYFKKFNMSTKTNICKQKRTKKSQEGITSNLVQDGFFGDF